MKLLNMNCPNCGSKLSVNKDSGECRCESCGGVFMLDDESTTQHIKYDNAEEAGYQFEKGRQKAQKENARNYATINTVRPTVQQKKKSNIPIWLWIILWLCFWPFLAIYFIYKSNLPQKWKIGLISGLAVIILIVSIKGCVDKANEPASNESEYVAEITSTLNTNDSSIASDDVNGVVTGDSNDPTTITAISSNGESSESSASADDSLRSFQLSISRQREDSNNIGDEWSHTRKINGVAASNGVFTASVGDTLEFYVRSVEEDDNPDIGEATVTHTVTQEDFDNGFVVTVDVYATENGGRNSGQSAHFITTFTFEP
ncbi:MAG: hypothetical protein IKN80_07990 [Clostridiales bacterium]|nr:hypothetical protein [Clostridiales bacterium]